MMMFCGFRKDQRDRGDGSLMVQESVIEIQVLVRPKRKRPFLTGLSQLSDQKGKDLRTVKIKTNGIVERLRKFVYRRRR